jgi:hypothetical protein
MTKKLLVKNISESKEYKFIHLKKKNLIIFNYYFFII